jgi:hypothetical protein
MITYPQLWGHEFVCPQQVPGRGSRIRILTSPRQVDARKYFLEANFTAP